MDQFDEDTVWDSITPHSRLSAVGLVAFSAAPYFIQEMFCRMEEAAYQRDRRPVMCFPQQRVTYLYLNCNGRNLGRSKLLNDEGEEKRLSDRYR